MLPGELKDKAAADGVKVALRDLSEQGRGQGGRGALHFLGEIFLGRTCGLAENGE